MNGGDRHLGSHRQLTDSEGVKSLLGNQVSGLGKNPCFAPFLIRQARRLSSGLQVTPVTRRYWMLDSIFY